MTETTEHAEGTLKNWFLLMDPSWRPTKENEDPPAEAVVGVCPVGDDGTVGRFRANPAYVPSSEDAPSDPLDVVFRLMRRGQADSWHLRLMLRDTLCDVAVNGDAPLITKSPDGVPCAVVATAQVQRARIRAPHWKRVDLDELVGLLADGVDVLFNPGGPAAVRLTGDFLRETTLLGDDQFDAPASIDGVEEPRISRWEPGPRDVESGFWADDWPVAREDGAPAAPADESDTPGPVTPRDRRAEMFFVPKAGNPKA